MANRYFAGNSLAAFSRTSGNIFETTGAGFNAAFVSNSIQFNSSVDTATSWPFSATSPTIWLRFDLQNANGVGGTGNFCAALYNAGVGVFRLAWGSSSGQLNPQYWNGSTWVATGAAITGVNGLNTFVVAVTLGSGFQLFQGGVLVSSGSGWTGTLPMAVTNVVLGAQSSGFTTYMSQIMCADYDLRSSNYAVPAINGNSAVNTGQVLGAYTDINEVPLNDSTLVQIQTVGNKAGFTKAGITVSAGYQISGMVINARAEAVAGVGVVDGKLGIRSAGTNYSSTTRGVGSGLGPVGYIAGLDPATSALFSQSGFNAAEFYLEAA